MRRLARLSEICLATRLAPLLLLAAGLLLPWVAYLVVTLPSEHTAAHWDVAWAGFDVALAALLAAVAVAALRRSWWLEGAATAAATLLVVDAWFDALTARSGTELAAALGEAVLVELPLAVLCLLLARAAKRRIQLLAAAEQAQPRRRLRLVTAPTPAPAPAEPALREALEA
jgi:hypothetical protein